MFVINGARASSMEQTIARIAGASYEFFTGSHCRRPQPALAALSSGERECVSARAGSEGGSGGQFQIALSPIPAIA